MKKYKLRTNGVALVALILNEIFYTFVALVFIRAIFTDINNKEDLWKDIVILIICILIIIYIYLYIFLNRIVIRNGEMIIQGSNKLFNIKKINIKDISNVYYGGGNFIYNKIKDNDYYVKKIYEYCKSYGEDFKVVMGITNLIVVTTVDGQIGISRTKLFLKKDIKKFIDNIKKLNLNVVLESEKHI